MKNFVLNFFKKNNPFKNHPNVIQGTNNKYGKYYNISIAKSASIEIKNNVCFREFWQILVYDSAVLVIGENVFFNSFCSINCLESIFIGSNTIFGEGVKIYDHNHTHSAIDGYNIERNYFNKAPIKIGSNCWIGSNVTILKGVEIGNNVIVGANAFIYKSVPSNSIVKHEEVLIIESR